MTKRERKYHTHLRPFQYKYHFSQWPKKKLNARSPYKRIMKYMYELKRNPHPNKYWWAILDVETGHIEATTYSDLPAMLQPVTITPDCFNH